MATRLDNIPVPDPSALTTDQLRRELSSLREILEGRLDGMDRATALAAHVASRVPSDTDKQIDHLRGLHEEKFQSVQTQFAERDVRAKAAESAAAIAVNAALQAQKEAAAAQNDANNSAITKSEAATVKQIDGILALLVSNTKAIDEKITSINGRLDRGEGAGSGRAGSQASMLAIGALMVSMIIGGFAIVNGFNHASITPDANSRRVDDLVARLDSMTRSSVVPLPAK